MAEEEIRLVDPNEPDAAPENDTSQVQRKLGHSKWIKISLGVAAALLLVAIAFAVGLLIGRKLGPGTVTPAPGFNWGASVKIDGREVAVVDWLDDFIEAKRIEEDLQ